MNKQKKVIIAVLTLVVTMMVGYALFSETLTINGTATAKGDFNLTYTCDLLTSNNATIDEPVTVGGTGSCKVNGNTITTTSNLNKPTDMVAYRVKVTNGGSIPAVLKTARSDNNCLNDSPFQKTCPGDEVYFDKSTGLSAGYSLVELNEDGSINPNKIYIGDGTIQSANITLQPGKFIYLYVYSLWVDSENLPQPTLPETGITKTYNVTLGFEQLQAQ